MNTSVAATPATPATPLATEESPITASKKLYDNKRTKISVSFNLEIPEEFAMHEYAKNMTFSVWAKERIAEEIAANKRKNENKKT